MPSAFTTVRVVCVVVGLFGGLAAGREPQDRARQSATGSSPDGSEETLSMSKGVVCASDSIKGYENYQELPGAALTREEKLHVYYRPLGYQTSYNDGFYEAHFIQDAEIRRRGEKTVLRQKKKLLEYHPRGRERPALIYLRNAISLKELPPGDYDLNIILYDEIAKGAPATQIVPFKIIPAQDPRQAAEDDAASSRTAPKKARRPSPRSQSGLQTDRSRDGKL
jgi:hypothetical protein